MLIFHLRCTMQIIQKNIFFFYIITSPLTINLITTQKSFKWRAKNDRHKPTRSIKYMCCIRINTITKRNHHSPSDHQKLSFQISLGLFYIGLKINNNIVEINTIANVICAYN